MTDLELVKALRCCYGGELTCDDCPLKCNEMACVSLTPLKAADRLEALLAENERLKAQLPKWVSVKERLPELTEDEIKRIEHFGFELAPEFVVLIKCADKPTVLRFDGEKWFDDNGTWYRVECWHSLHELPGTEEVEQWARRF